MFEDLTIIAEHSKRVTVLPKDLALLKELKKAEY